jgi:hypothetical protein
MTDIQQSSLPPRSAGENAQAASISDDSKASTAAIAALQAEAQRRIVQGRHDHIGSPP